MDVQHLQYDDESVVRAALQAAYPTERPVFSQRRGAQIIHAAAVHAREGGDRRRPFVGGRIAACMAAAFILFAGTAGAASAALPGERLYPIKQVVERAMIAMTNDDVQAARLELRFAERRLDEAVSIPGDADGELSSALSDRFHEHLNAASSLAGDEIAGEVEQLEQSRDEQRTGDAKRAVPAVDTPADVEPQQQLDGEVVAPEAVASPSPVPSVGPSPQPEPSPTTAPVPTSTADPSTGPSPPPTPSPSGSMEPTDVRRPPDDAPGEDLTPTG